MKNAILSLLLLLLLKTSAAAITAQVDQRVEIMSIVARLAGYSEYNDKMAVQYVSGIHDHFDRYATDSLIHFARDIRRSGIGFDAVMTMAVNLVQRGSAFSLQPNWKKDIDNRWTDSSAIRFVRLLNRFYRKSNAAAFFRAQEAYYTKTIRAFGEVLAGFNQSWYFSYYGVKPGDDFMVLIGCGNGGSNYGPSITNRNGSRKVFAIMGSWSFNKELSPVFSRDAYLPTLIHEFNHSFINPTIESFTGNPVLHASMQIILDSMKTEMEEQAYQKWETVLVESIVRASVIRYLMSQSGVGLEVIENEMMDQLNRGFIWTRELVSLLGVYESDRERYPAINDFYPVIIDFFKRTASGISLLKAEHEMKLPKVISIEPIHNNDDHVDTSITQLIIRFNTPMPGKGYSFATGEWGKEADPITGIAGYTNDNTALRVNIKLRPAKQYEIVLTGRLFINARGYRLKRYVIRFKTRGDEEDVVLHRVQ